MLELKALEDTKKQTIKLYEEAIDKEIKKHYWEKLIQIERKIRKLQEGKVNNNEKEIAKLRYRTIKNSIIISVLFICLTAISIVYIIH